MKDKIIKLGLDERIHEIDDEEKPNDPVDVEFELGLIPQVKEIFIPLDLAKDNLFVIKPIDK